jgi:hypothetical protein
LNRAPLGPSPYIRLAIDPLASVADHLPPL